MISQNINNEANNPIIQNANNSEISTNQNPNIINNTINGNRTNVNLPTNQINSNNINNNQEIRQNRFLNIQDNRRLDIELSNSSSVQNRNIINQNNENDSGNRNLNNNLNNENHFNNNRITQNFPVESNLITPTKDQKNLQIKNKKYNKNIQYNFSNATALFSTSDNLFLINKKGEVFTINENNGEMNLESKNFSKNIECYATNSTHIFFYEKDSKYIFKACINKNMDYENEEKLLNLNKIEIEKKIFSDFNKDENSIFLAHNNIYKMNNLNHISMRNLENKSVIKKYSFESNEPLLNLSNNIICKNCLCSTVLNNEEMKNEEKQKTSAKEQERIIFNNIMNNPSDSISKNINLVYKLDSENSQYNANNNLLNNIQNNILLDNNFTISNNREMNNFDKFIDKEREKSLNLNLNHSDNLGYANNNNLNLKNHKDSLNKNNKTIFLNPKKFSTFSNYLKIEKFYELEESIVPTKLICDDNKLVIIDKNGELNKLYIVSKEIKKFQCLFMLRNCHLNNSVLIGDGDLILLDPVRLSLNKLNILTGTEIIILHSVKFLSSIKFLFTNNTKIYFIDTSGNLYNFNEFDKKIMQIGSNGLCKYIIDFSVHKNYLFTIENNSSLYRTNLNDGIYKEFKSDYIKNYSQFLSDNQVLIFITKDDKVNILIPNNEELVLKKQFKFENISKYSAITLFKKNLIFYNKEKKTIECININEEDIESRVLVENFGDVLSFINNNDCLACIIKDCVIFKLYC